MHYNDIISLRRSLKIPGYTSLSDLGFDGDWVSAYQIGSRSPDGPVLVADNWLDVPSFRENETILRSLGYLPGIKFNNVLDIALSMAGLKRAHIYVTQAFHLLPDVRSPNLGMKPDCSSSSRSTTRP